MNGNNKSGTFYYLFICLELAIALSRRTEIMHSFWNEKKNIFNDKLKKEIEEDEKRRKTTIVQSKLCTLFSLNLFICFE